MRIAAVGVLCISIAAISFAGESWAAIKYPTHVEAQGLGPALEVLAREHGFQVLCRTEILSNVRVHALNGDLSTDDALHQLLSGSGLTYRYLGRGAITIVPVDVNKQSNSLSSSRARGDSTATPPTKGAAKGGGPSSGPFRLAQVAQGQDSGAAPVGPQETYLEEIVVTAQKRAQLVQDVPIAMSVVNTGALTERNQSNIGDYFSSIPGLDFAGSTGLPAQTLAIRGMTTGAGADPTVGVMIDDFPFGASVIGATAGSLIPEVDPSDLQRIEVLRGPQGTLYGASSMGGLVKFVTVTPSFSGVSGDVSVGTDEVYKGSPLGYSTHAAVNIPLSSDVAVRASGFYRGDSGYIDNAFLGTDDVNRDHAYGGLITALWAPFDGLSVKALALHQTTTGSAFNLVAPSPGVKNYQQDFISGAGYNFSRAQLYGLTVSYALGAAHLTVASGYGIGSGYTVNDLSSVLGSLNPPLGFDVSGEQGPFYQRTSKWTDEARVQFPITSRVDVLMGAFFTHEVTHFWQSFLASDPSSGVVAGTALRYVNPNIYLERAGFTDLTFHITHRLDLQLGGRGSYFTQEGQWGLVEGPAAPLFGDPSSAPYFYPAGPAINESTYTYLATPKLSLTRNLVIYIRAASGYRPGGDTPLVNIRFDPDKAKDYEIGLKGRAWGGRLSVDASAYYIEWKDIQLSLINSLGISYTGNAGAAKSQGLELSSQLHPLRSLHLSAWVDFSQAVLTEGFPQFGSGFNSASSVYGVAGDPLPWSPRFSAYLSAEKANRLTASLTGAIGAEVSYQGSRLDSFTGTSQRQYLSPYAKVDAHASLSWSSWRINCYVNNITNRYALLSGGLGSVPPVFNVLRPRTVGVSVTEEF